MTDQSIDDQAVDKFAAMMKAKLAASAAKGRSGWREMPEEALRAMLLDHVSKGDMRDVANIAMMIHLNRQDAGYVIASDFPSTPKEPDIWVVPDDSTQISYGPFAGRTIADLWMTAHRAGVRYSILGRSEMNDLERSNDLTDI